jgi:hypothetical protein
MGEGKTAIAAVIQLKENALVCRDRLGQIIQM